jgi:hypothetical protein
MCAVVCMCVYVSIFHFRPSIIPWIKVFWNNVLVNCIDSFKEGLECTTFFSAFMANVC